jgi:hypothetical protein
MTVTNPQQLGTTRGRRNKETRRIFIAQSPKIHAPESSQARHTASPALATVDGFVIFKR